MRIDNDDSISKDLFSISTYFANSIIAQKENLILCFWINYRQGIEYDFYKNIFYLKNYPGINYVSLLESINSSNNFNHIA